MAEIQKNVLNSLVSSLNAVITFARETAPHYRSMFGDAINILEKCYLIPSDLRGITKFQVGALKEILDTSFSAKQTSGINKEIDDTENYVYDIFRQFDRYKKMYIATSSNILDKLSSIKEIHEIIEKMKDIAREIKLFSINSVIVASQAGSSGIAFKSISRFIIELSDAIQKSASQLEIYRDKILTTHEKIEGLFQRLIQDIYEKRAVDLKKEILDAIQRTKSQFNFIGLITNNLDQRINQSIQEGQIAERQYKPGTRNLPMLEYWIGAIEMLGEIPEKNISEDSPSDILSSVAYATHILGALSKRMNNNDVLLNSFLGRIDSLYSSLVQKFGVAQQDTMYIFNYLSINSGQYPSLLERIFSQFTVGLNKLQTLLTEEEKVKNELLEVFNEMYKIHTEGLSFFSNFEKFYVIMNNINVLAQIEMSKQDFDGSNNTGLKVKFTNMLEQLKVFNEDIKKRIQKILQFLIIQINTFVDTQAEQSGFLSETHFFLDAERSRLKYSQDTVKGSIDAIREENGKIFSIENQAKNSIAAFIAHGKDYVRTTDEIYKSVIQHQEKFLGLVDYYALNLREYAVNNPFIQAYEKRQSTLAGGS